MDAELLGRVETALDDAWTAAGNNGGHPLAEKLRALPVPCENDGDGLEHYAKGHRVYVAVNPSEAQDGIFTEGPARLCTKCCDRAKACGYLVRNA